MASYEIIPTMKLSFHNELTSPGKHLPELVHLNDDAKSVFIDFSKVMPATITANTTIDTAIQEMKQRQQTMLLIEEKGQVIGLISIEDLVSERPIRLMQERDLSRSELTVNLLMTPYNEILVMEITSLRHAKVGHIISTIKTHATYYILVVKKQKNGKHLIKGLFSASQIVKQLHTDISSIVTNTQPTIAELYKERKA